jgi:hypothetical protein
MPCPDDLPRPIYQLLEHLASKSHVRLGEIGEAGLSDALWAAWPLGLVAAEESARWRLQAAVDHPCYRKLPDSFNPLLWLSRAGRERLDFDRLGQGAARPAHSADFTSVDWFGAEYRFAKGLQAESVRALWEAWENGTPSLSEKTIAEKSGSANDRFRLEHVFKPANKKTGKREPHAAWGAMIVSAGKGLFKLAAGDSESPK